MLKKISFISLILGCLFSIFSFGSSAMNKERTKWTNEEIQRLMNLVKPYQEKNIRIKWANIVNKFPGRTSQQIKQKQYDQENKEKKVLYHQQYYQKNKYQISKYQQQYRKQFDQEHKEKINQTNKQYYQENKSKIACQQKSDITLHTDEIDAFTFVSNKYHENQIPLYIPRNQGELLLGYQSSENCNKACREEKSFLNQSDHKIYEDELDSPILLVDED